MSAFRFYHQALADVCRVIAGLAEAFYAASMLVKPGRPASCTLDELPVKNRGQRQEAA
ncbi:MAG TPA: hypothetical protein VFX01_04370 [Methylophilaceae bacterium]|nr:hypothetical protein [Methylophilaceae bacterium]